MTDSNFVDVAGNTRLRGTYAGGGPPSTLAIEGVAATTTVAPGLAFLTWANAYGATLLDYTTPDQPIITAAGCYAISVGIVANGASVAGGPLLALLQLRAVQGGHVNEWPVQYGEVGTAKPPRFALAATCQVDANCIARVILNVEIADTLDYTLSGTVQRLA